jgi:hypothetical protein
MSGDCTGRFLTISHFGLNLQGLFPLDRDNIQDEFSSRDGNSLKKEPAYMADTPAQSGTPGSVKVTHVGDKVSVEFEIEDLVNRLLHPVQNLSCMGCMGCMATIASPSISQK